MKPKSWSTPEQKCMICMNLSGFPLIFCLFCSISDRKSCFSIRKSILTNERCAEPHTLAWCAVIVLPTPWCKHALSDYMIPGSFSVAGLKNWDVTNENLNNLILLQESLNFLCSCQKKSLKKLSYLKEKKKNFNLNKTPHF